MLTYVKNAPVSKKYPMNKLRELGNDFTRNFCFQALIVWPYNVFFIFAPIRFDAKYISWTVEINLSKFLQIFKEGEIDHHKSGVDDILTLLLPLNHCDFGLDESWILLWFDQVAPSPNSSSLAAGDRLGRPVDLASDLAAGWDTFWVKFGSPLISLWMCPFAVFRRFFLQNTVFCRYSCFFLVSEECHTLKSVYCLLGDFLSLSL